MTSVLALSRPRERGGNTKGIDQNRALPTGRHLYLTYIYSVQNILC